MEKRRQGIRLTPKEELEFQKRLSVEAQIEREGGRVLESAVPKKPAEMTAGQKGAAEMQSAIDARNGQQATLRRNGMTVTPEGVLQPAPSGIDGAISATAKMRRSPITNDATDEQKAADNAAGPHMGADGQPATWNMPKRVAGRFGGASMEGDAGAPDGTIAITGQDGARKLWNGVGFKPAAASAVAAAPAMAAPPPAAPAAAQRPISEDVAYIEKSGYGDFLNNPVAARSVAAKNFAAPPVIKPDTVQPSAVSAAPAPAPTAPVIQPDAMQPGQPLLAGMPTANGAGIGSMLADSTSGPISPAVKNAFAPPAPSAPRVGVPNTPGNYQPSSLTDIISRRAPAVARAASAVGNVLNPPTAAWNGPSMTGQTLASRTITRPKPVQSDAMVSDPLEEERKRRALAMQPE